MLILFSKSMSFAEVDATKGVFTGNHCVVAAGQTREVPEWVLETSTFQDAVRSGAVVVTVASAGPEPTITVVQHKDEALKPKLTIETDPIKEE